MTVQEFHRAVLDRFFQTTDDRERELLDALITLYYNEEVVK